MHRPDAPRLQRVEELRDLAPGEEAWLRLLGPCLEPLVRSGEWLRVQRCDEAPLAPGDLAVVETPRGFVAHLVTSVAPLRTETLLGRIDVGPLVALGRVEAVQKGRATLPLPRSSRLLLQATQSALSALSGRDDLRAGYRLLRDRLAVPVLSRLEQVRRGPPEVRPLGPSDIASFFTLAAREEPDRLPSLRTSLVRELLPERRVWGLWDAEGKLRLYGYLERLRDTPEDVSTGQLWGPRGSARLRGSAWEAQLRSALLGRARELGWQRLVAQTLEGDVRSARGLAAAGFTEETRTGRVHRWRLALG